MLWCLYATITFANNARTTTFVTWRVVSGGEKVVGSIPPPLSTRHVASCGEICRSNVVSDLLESGYLYFDMCYRRICSVCVCVCVCKRLHYMWCDGGAEISAGEGHVMC